jgi:hypothetical protein
VTTRELTDEERKLVRFMLTEPFPGRDELLRQLESVQTRGSSCDCGCPSFWLDPAKDLPPADVLESVPVSATGRDPGGNLVGVLLFVNNGYMSDLEVFSFEEHSVFAGSSSGRLSDRSLERTRRARRALSLESAR